MNGERHTGATADNAGSARVWLRGGVTLAADAFVGSVGIVHGVHRAVLATVSRFNPAARAIAPGTDFVYHRVRDVGRLAFFGAGQAVGLAETLRPARRRDLPARLSLGLHSALNGAFGDYLERSDNALSLSMRLVTTDGRTLEPTAAGLHAALPEAGPRLVLLVHGLGMNDRQWQQGRRADFGSRLAADHGYTALRLRYNSGRHISENGRDLAQLLEGLYHAYPGALERLTIIGHSMGGLVARSALHYAVEAQHAWPRALADLVSLGAPHLGAPLERLGEHVTRSLTRLAHTAPLAAIGEIRSAGVKDLRHGNLLDEDWQADRRPTTPLRDAPHVGHFLVAATLGRRADDPLGRVFGDLLVPVESAVGHGSARLRRARGGDSDGCVFYGMNHFELIHHDDVYAAIAQWLAPRLDAFRASSSSTH